MARRTCIAFLSLIALFANGQKSALADHDSEKHKIYDKYEIVSFGQTQSFIQTNLRILEGAEEWFGINNDDKTVYEKRYETLKFHWDDFRTKCKENHVDMKKEHIYFGAIQWTPKDSVTGLPEDHKVQFYLAVRKKNRDGNDLPEIAKYTLQVSNKKFAGWYLDIDGHADSAKEGKWTVARNILLTKEDGPRWKATKGKQGTKLSVVAPHNKFDGWYLDIDGHAKPTKEGKWTVARNLTLTKEDGAVDWQVNRGTKGVKLAVQAPQTKFDGWYLDFDGHADFAKKGKWTSADNLMLNKDDGPEWQAISE